MRSSGNSQGGKGLIIFTIRRALGISGPYEIAAYQKSSTCNDKSGYDCKNKVSESETILFVIALLWCIVSDFGIWRWIG